MFLSMSNRSINPQPKVLITGGEGDLARALGAAFAQDGWEVLLPGKKELDVSSERSVTKYFAKSGYKAPREVE